MNVHGIVKEWLKAKGFDGLFSDDGECGCEVDDLGPCGEMSERCEPGYKALCTEECSHEGDHDVSRGDWHIQKEKPSSPPSRGPEK